MKTPALAVLAFLVPAIAFSAQPKAQPKGFTPHPVTATFYVANVQCERCVDTIRDSLKKVASFKEIKMRPSDGFALISFDTHVSSYHQIAQAIQAAEPQHGQKYVPTLKMKVPEYAQADNAAKVDAVFAKRSEWVKVETVNRATGEFVIHFLPLKAIAGKSGPQGWNGGHFGHPIHDAPPKGLGLKFELKREGAAKVAGKAKKK